MIPATAVMTASVMPLLRSEGANANTGGMKKKSKLNEVSAAVERDGPISKRVEITTTPRRLIITSSEGCKYLATTPESAVVSTTVSTPQT